MLETARTRSVGELKKQARDIVTHAAKLIAVAGPSIGGLFNGGRTNPFELNFWGFVFAVIVAVLLVGVAEGLSNRNRNRAVR